MAQKESILAIVIVFLVATIESRAEEGSSSSQPYRNIWKFLNTTDAIYSYRISREGVECKVDYSISENATDVSFQRYIPGSASALLPVKGRQSTRPVVTGVTGTFYYAQLPNEAPDGMCIKYEKDGASYTEAIDRQSSNDLCALFSVAGRTDGIRLPPAVQ
uniref:Putative lipocalin-3 1 n=1 Tax=Amblyomma cajennense TaxID=34607 RepID=A0A023FG25_AMBCJ